MTNELSGYRFPPEIIHQAILAHLRFTLNFGEDVEDSCGVHAGIRAEKGAQQDQAASAAVADWCVGDFFHADVEQHLALHPGVDRADQRLAHLGEIEAVEMVEVDRVVVVDIAEGLVDQDRFGAIAGFSSVRRGRSEELEIPRRRSLTRGA